MAVLTISHMVGAAWVNISTAAAMADGSSYRIEVQDEAETGAGHVITARTDNNVAPAAGARGGTLYPRTAAGMADRRTFEKVAGQHWWARSSGPAMHVIVDPV